MPVQTQLQIRRDTAANWTSVNPTLAGGEWGLETDTRQYKIGDGATAWNSLGYQLGPLLDEEIATDPTGAYFDGTGLRLYGVISNFASAPDSAALDITGDIDIRVKVALDDWTPQFTNVLISKSFGNVDRAYNFYVGTTGTLAIQWSSDGGTTNLFTAISTIATGFTDGSTKWVRVTLDVDNGASGRDIKFYTSDDGTNWTQLGNTVTQAGTTSIFASAALLQIGVRGAGGVATASADFANGTFYRAQVLNGIGGTTAFDADFSAVPADSFAFTESSANAATVTLTTTRYSFGLPNMTITGTTTLATQANRTWYTPFTVRNKPITLKHFALEAQAAPASNSTTRVAIYYADNQGQPTGNKIIDSGAITVASAAAAIYRVRLTPTILNPGNYLLALNSSVSFTARVWLGNTLTLAPNTLGANVVDQYYVAETLSGGVFPTTGTKWNTRNTANAAFKDFALLGWS